MWDLQARTLGCKPHMSHVTTANYVIDLLFARLNAYVNTPDDEDSESPPKGVFRCSIFVIRTFFQDSIRIPANTSKFLVLIRTMTYTSPKKNIVESHKTSPTHPPALLHFFRCPALHYLNGRGYFVLETSISQNLYNLL